MSIIAAVSVPAIFHRAAPSATSRPSCLCIPVSPGFASAGPEFSPVSRRGESGGASSAAPPWDSRGDAGPRAQPRGGSALLRWRLRDEVEVVLERDLVIDANDA